MAMRIVADSLDDIPEGLRDAAKQEGTVFVVGAMPEGWAVENVSGLKQSVIRERDAVSALSAVAKDFGWRWDKDKGEWKERGFDSSRLPEAREALEKLAAGQLRGSKEIEEFKASVEQKFAKDRQALEAKLDARTKLLREQLSRGQLAPIIAAKGGSESMDAILTLASSHIAFEECEDGTLKASLVGKDGKSLVTSKSGSAEPMGFEEFVEQMRDAPATRGLFRVSATGGAGSSSQSGGSGQGAQLHGQPMSARENLARGLAQLGKK